MASKKCPKCGGRNKVDAKKCVKCNHSFDNLAPSFVQGSAWSASDTYEDPDGTKTKPETEPFWRTIMILGIILTATVLLIGFGLPLLGFGFYGVSKKINESNKFFKIGIIACSIVMGILVYKFILYPLFT